MKFIIALAFLVAGISALPQPEDASPNHAPINPDSIVNAIYDASKYIRDANLDPLYVTREVREFALPVPVIFNATAVVEEVICRGLSDIRIYIMHYDVFTQRLDFDVEMPDINLWFGHAAAEVTVFGEKLTASARGYMDILKIRAIGQVYFRLGLITAPSVRSVNVDFTVDRINSHLENVFVQNQDISNKVNIFIGGTIPHTLYFSKDDINQLLEIYLFDFITARL